MSRSRRTRAGSSARSTGRMSPAGAASRSRLRALTRVASRRQALAVAVASCALGAALALLAATRTWTVEVTHRLAPPAEVRTPRTGSVLEPWLTARSKAHPGGLINIEAYNETYLRLWWAGTRIGGYLLPFVVWKLMFRRDSLLDFGLRPTGFREHAWIYALCVAVMIPLMLIIKRQPDFGSYYPMYKLAGRSWFDFVLWETIYIAQFLGLEMFFRGWWIRATRVFGIGAIWSMVVTWPAGVIRRTFEVWPWMGNRSRLPT